MLRAPLHGSTSRTDACSIPADLDPPFPDSFCILS